MEEAAQAPEWLLDATRKREVACRLTQRLEARARQRRASGHPLTGDEGDQAWWSQQEQEVQAEVDALLAAAPDHREAILCARQRLRAAQGGTSPD